MPRERLATWLLAATAFLAMTAYWPLWPDGAIAPKWAILSLGLPLCLWFTTIQGSRIGYGFLAFAALSLLWTSSLMDGIEALWFLGLLIAAFLLGHEASANQRQWVYRALIAGVSISGLIALLQVKNQIGIAQSPYSPIPAALFGHKNFLAEIGVVTLVLAFLSREYWGVPGTALATLLPESRAAWGALTIVGLALLWKRHPFITIYLAILGLLLSPLLWRTPDVPWHTDSIMERLAFWSGTLANFHWLGHGIGSFWSSFPSFGSGLDLSQMRPQYAHNELIEAISEFGVMALIPVAIACLALTAKGREPERHAFLALLCVSLFGFPFHLPATLLAGGFLAGVLYRQRAWLRDPRTDGAATVERRRVPAAGGEWAAGAIGI